MEPIDVTDLKYQADPAFMPNKESTWKGVPAKDSGWVHAHNAIRYEITSMKSALERIGDATLAQWQVQCIVDWWDGHSIHVHEHHENEDNIFNPFLRSRVVYPEKLEADHVELVACMDRIAACVGALEADRSRATELREMWTRYEELMLPHLLEEEHVGLPLCRAYFTPKEVEAVTNQFLKGADPRSLGAFFHAMGGKREALKFASQNGIPWFVWFVPSAGFKALRKTYRKRMVSHIDSLIAGKVVSSVHKPKIRSKGSQNPVAAADENARPNAGTADQARTERLPLR